MKQRFAVLILQQAVYVVDQSTPLPGVDRLAGFQGQHSIVRHWPAPRHPDKCDYCGSTIGESYCTSHDDIRQAIELAQKLNRDEDRKDRQEAKDRHQNEISQAAVTMGANNVNLVT
jgi:hypothetical protein